MRRSMNNNDRLYVKSFPGATVRDLVDYSVPSKRYSPDLYILQGGGNDLVNKNPEAIANELIDLAKDLKTPENEVLIGGIMARTDRFQEKGKTLDHILKGKCLELNIGFIDHSNINSTHINNSGIHLSPYGSRVLANNYLRAINI